MCHFHKQVFFLIICDIVHKFHEISLLSSFSSTKNAEEYFQIANCQQISVINLSRKRQISVEVLVDSENKDSNGKYEFRMYKKFLCVTRSIRFSIPISFISLHRHLHNRMPIFPAEIFISQTESRLFKFTPNV